VIFGFPFRQETIGFAYMQAKAGNTCIILSHTISLKECVKFIAHNKSQHSRVAH
jgi:hypothetical protein